MWFVLADALMLPTALLALWFALEYAGLRDRVPQGAVALLIASVVLRAILMLVDLAVVFGGRAPLVGGIGQELGPLALVFAVYLLGLLLLGTAVLALLFIRSPAHRVPVALILVAHVGVRLAYLYTAFGSGDGRPAPRGYRGWTRDRRTAMRRLAAFLVVGVLLAALVPSVTLAGKPVPVVNTVTVAELNLQGPDLCALTVAITFTGRAQYAQFAAVKDGTVVSTPNQTIARGDTTAAQTFQMVTLGANAWSWKVQLLDRKLKPIGAAVQTNEETHTAATCPSDGAVLATYP